MNFLAQTYDYNYTYSSGDSSTNGAATALSAGFFLVMWLVLFALFALPAIIVMWKLFTKAGKPGWASIVPIYNLYVFGKIAGVSDGMIWGYIISTVLCIIPFINFIAWIPAIILGILILIEFIKKYDRDVVFWLLYIFLPIVAVFMVKDAKYKGSVATSANNSNASASAPKPEAQSEDQQAK